MIEWKFFHVLLKDGGMFQSSELEARDKEINEADEMCELMTTGEALHKAMLGREGVDEVVSKHTEERMQAFV